MKAKELIKKIYETIKPKVDLLSGITMDIQDDPDFDSHVVAIVRLDNEDGENESLHVIMQSNEGDVYIDEGELSDGGIYDGVKLISLEQAIPIIEEKLKKL